MDFFDEMFNKTPKEKFIEIIQNGNLGALEKVFEEFFADHIEERQNDIYIELGAKILGHEG